MRNENCRNCSWPLLTNGLIAVLLQEMAKPMIVMELITVEQAWYTIV